MNTPDLFTVEVQEVRRPNEPGPHTVLLGRGTDTLSGEEVIFAGDWRPMLGLQGALDQGEQPIAFIEAWQILERRRP